MGPRSTPTRATFAGIFVVTWLGLLTIGATLPVLPRYVTGPVGAGDVAVGIVTGAFAATGLLFRPIGGAIADARGRKPVLVVGSLLVALAGALYFVPAGVGGLIVARLFLGAGEGMVYTAGAAWIVDLAPPAGRARIIGLYGLAIWGGLSLGAPLGELLLELADYELVWGFATLAPLIGTAVALRLPATPARPADVDAPPQRRLERVLAREALGPGAALGLSVVGFATMAGFVVLHLDARDVGHGGGVFTAFAATVVATRLLGGGLADRFGTACAAGAGLAQAVGLATLALAHSLAVALIGAVVLGIGFALLFPALALIVVERVGERRRGVAMGTFTAFFDVGMGIGAPLAGAIAALAGYGSAFAVAALLGLGTIVLALAAGRRPTRAPAPAAGSAR